MTPNLRKKRTLTEKGISFASESNIMPPPVGDPGVADDQASTGQDRSPSEDNQPSAELNFILQCLRMMLMAIILLIP